jgi:CMP-N-acetylneuraminate monooxygenase
MNYYLGPVLKNLHTVEEHHIPMPSSDGFSESGDFIVGRANERWVAYDRICDHNGGLLCLDKGRSTATCQIHKWTLILADATYENNCRKKTLPVREQNGGLVITANVERFPAIVTSELIEAHIDLSFNAHASVSLNCAGLRLTTDPWLVGSCFATGWWHAYPPSLEAIERLQQSNCIYISHNHPDHLHMPTLEAYVAKSQLFLIPAFESGSVEKLLRRHGYNNLIVADFLQEVKFQDPAGIVSAMLIRAGDGRDDSSLLVHTREDTILFGVDTNMPNKWVLPKVDVLFTPFAGGASGFPSRIANFSNERKIEIISANRATVLTNHVDKLVKATRPAFVVPYAGYFTEAPRDEYVSSINQKNSAADLVSFVETNFPGVRGINPLNTPVFTLKNGKIETREVFETPSYFLDDEYIAGDMQIFTTGVPRVDNNRLEALGRKLIASSFTDDLTVIFIATDDAFAPVLSHGLAVDFSAEHRGWRLLPVEGNDDVALAASLSGTTNNIEILRIRADIMAGALSRGLPLEDLSIGFQILMYRQPNVYNFKFWDHFTNVEFIAA